MNNRVIKAFLCLLFFSILTTSHAALSVNMGNSVESSGIHTFPNLYVSGNSTKGYLIRFGFSGATAPGDAINLPSLPSGWNETITSTSLERIITISPGATADDLQAFLRLVEITVASARAGQELFVWIGEDSETASRNVYYCPDNDHWYEYVGAYIQWVEAYNAALEKRFSGLSGYLVTITSGAEETFLNSIAGGDFWLAATRMDIRDVQDPVTGRLSGVPATSLDYWYWTAGPEWIDNGKNPENSVFYKYKVAGGAEQPVTVTYPYTNWLAGEPNDWDGLEAYGYSELSKGGEWSDYSGSGNRNYIVEYSGTIQSVSANGIIVGASVKNASVDGTANNGTPALPVLLYEGEMLTYTITAANLSTTSTAVMVRDTVPEGLDIVSGSITNGGVFNAATREIVWTLSIPVGDELDVSFSVEKIAGATNLMTNTAYVISDGVTVKSTNSTYHTGEAKLRHISYQYMACPGAVVEVGFYQQEGVSFEWYDAPVAGTHISSDNSVMEPKDNSAVQAWYVEVTYDGNVLSGRIPVYLELAANCGATNPVGCAVEGTLLFKEDFGGNDSSDPNIGEPLDGDVISYTYVGAGSVNDGGYTIRKISNSSSAWYEVDDHTHPNDPTRGYMLQVNAAYEPGQFYSFRIDGLLSNSTLYFSTWIMSVLNYYGEHPTNAIFVLEDGDENVIAKYYTGNIPDIDPTWKQYGFEFTIPEGQTSVILKIINNGAGSSGNDFVMDDIEVRLCVPGADILTPVESDTIICVNQAISLIGSYTDRDNIYGNDLVYRWEWSTTGDISDPDAWSVISGTGISGISGTSNTGTVTSTLTINEMLPEYDMYYRFIVANAANIDEYYWRAMSRVIHIMIDTCIIPNADRVTTLADMPVEVNVLANDSLNGCAGHNVSLTLSTQLTAQHGTVGIINDNIVYTPDANWTGRDTFRYIITDCAGIFSDSAMVYIAVVEKPDNIIDADCWTTPDVRDWSFEKIAESPSQYKISNISTPLVGDLDGDGIIEIIVPEENPGNPISTVMSNKLFIFAYMNSSIQHKQTLDVPYISLNADPYAIGNVDGSNHAAIFVTTGYHANGSTDQLQLIKFSYNLVTDQYEEAWRNTYTTNSQYAGARPMLVDFNGDGIAEVVVLDKIFNAQTGVLIADAGIITGTSGINFDGFGFGGHASGLASWGNGTMPNTPTSQMAIGDIDNDGIPEVIGGNTVYKVNIVNPNVITDNSYTVFNKITATSTGRAEVKDGATAIADIDCDGYLDVIVTTIGSSATTAGLYIWDPRTGEVMNNNAIDNLPQYNLGGVQGISVAFAGDIDNDGYPEICFTGQYMMFAYKYNISTNNLDQLWSVTTGDDSGATAMSMFDFNQDGATELVYRDNQKLRIIDKNGNDIETANCASQTGNEYPVIADIDNDGEAEIIVTGSKALFVFGSSAGNKWAPARKVWNQYAYNAVNINENLTVPKTQLHPSTIFPGYNGILGTSDDVRPYNGYLMQQTALSTNGNPLWLIPDAYPDPVITGSAITGDSAYVTIGIINQGDAAIGAPIYVSLYKETVLASNLLETDSADIQINPADTGYITTAIALTDLELISYLAIRINDDGTEFTYQSECKDDNNVMSIVNPAIYQLIRKEALLEGVSGNGTYPNPVSVLFSEKIEYTITAVNISEISERVIIRDTLPPYLRYVTGSATTGAGITVDSSLNVMINSIPYDILKWEFATVPSLSTEAVSFKASPVEGVCASQPMFINRAWITVGNTIHLPTNYTYHQGASVGIVTFSAGYGGNIYNAAPQTLDYRTSPESGITIVPDEGYRFTGWSHEIYISLRGNTIEAQEGIVYYDTLTVYGNVELRANFELEKYRVNYYLNGSENSADNPATYTIISETIHLNAPEKAGDIFTGWTGSNGDEPQENVIIPNGSTGELEFYANFLYSGTEKENRTSASEPDDDIIRAVKDELYIRTSKAGAIVRIYTTEGILQKQYSVQTGESKVRLQKGLYVVSLNNSVGQIIIIE